MTYDKNNIFAKILRGEIPNDTVYEDDHVLAFNSIDPKTEIHVIVISKGLYSDYIDFSNNASNEEISTYFKAIAQIAKEKNIDEGCQILSNCGEGSGREVAHFHSHLFSGDFIKF